MSEYNEIEANKKGQHTPKSSKQEPLAYPFRSAPKQQNNNNNNSPTGQSVGGGGGSLGSGYSMVQQQMAHSTAQSPPMMAKNNEHKQRSNRNYRKVPSSKGENGNRYQATIKNGNVIVMQNNEVKSMYNSMQQQPQQRPREQNYGAGSNMRPPFGMPTAPRAPLSQHNRPARQRQKRRNQKRPPSTAAMSFNQIMQYSPQSG